MKQQLCAFIALILTTGCTGTFDDVPAVDPRPGQPPATISPSAATTPGYPTATPPATSQPGGGLPPVAPAPAEPPSTPGRGNNPPAMRPDAGGGAGGRGMRPDAGVAPEGGTGAATPPASTAEVCTSGNHWNGRNGPTMRPGQTCQNCHGFAVAGTVFPTLHEPTNCDGASGNLTVVITDANGATINLPVNRAGNFYSRGPVARPFRAKVVTSDGRERAMLLPQMNGTCNSCHTVSGANAAPGRIMAP
jgi:hypothetical protein